MANKIRSLNANGTVCLFDADSLESRETVMCKRNFIYDAVPSEDSYYFPSDFKYGSGASRGQFTFSYNKSSNQGSITFLFNWAAGIGPFMIAEITVTLTPKYTGGNVTQYDITNLVRRFNPFVSGGWTANDDFMFLMLLTYNTNVNTTTINYSIARTSGDQSPEYSISAQGTNSVSQTHTIIVPLTYVQGGGTN